MWSHLPCWVSRGSRDHAPGVVLRMAGGQVGCDGPLPNGHLLQVLEVQRQGPSCLGAPAASAVPSRPGCPERSGCVQGTWAAAIPRWAGRSLLVLAGRAGPRVWTAALGLRVCKGFSSEHESPRSSARALTDVSKPSPVPPGHSAFSEAAMSTCRAF